MSMSLSKIIDKFEPNSDLSSSLGGRGGSKHINLNFLGETIVEVEEELQ